MTRFKRVAPLALLVLTVAACGSTTADTIGLHYNDGPIEGQSFNRVVEPGSGSEFLGPGDSLVRIPINKRDYTFCAEVRPEPDDEGCDGAPITVTALGGANIAFSGGLSFVINSDSRETEDLPEGGVIRQFYEQLCRKFDCAGDDGLNDDGWAELLRVNVRGPLEDTLQEVVRGYTVDAIYAGTPTAGEAATDEEALSTLTTISNRVEELMRDTLNEFAGGTFFCGPAFSRSQPEHCPNLEFIITEVTPDEATREAFARNVASRQRVIDADANADAAVREAEGQRDAAETLASIASIPGYIEYLRALAMQACAENPECTLIVAPEGTDVNANAG